MSQTTGPSPVRVAVSVRPLHDDEQAAPGLVFDPSRGEVSHPSHTAVLNFENVFVPPHAGALFESCVAGLVDELLVGINSTIMAYGGRGSGKSCALGLTETSEPGRDAGGVLPLALARLFDGVDRLVAAGMRVAVSVSFVEIFGEQIRDLLAPEVDTKQNVTVRQARGRSVLLKGAETQTCTTEHQATASLRRGRASRQWPNRSHAIFAVTVTTESDADSTKAKLQIVDLASPDGQVQGDVKEDKSLEVMDQVVTALSTKRAQSIPYKDSSLTLMLQDSLGGNSKTILIACVDRAISSLDQTLRTLLYASKVRKIRNKPVRNSFRELVERHSRQSFGARRSALRSNTPNPRSVRTLLQVLKRENALLMEENRRMWDLLTHAYSNIPESGDEDEGDTLDFGTDLVKSKGSAGSRGTGDSLSKARNSLQMHEALRDENVRLETMLHVCSRRKERCSTSQDIDQDIPLAGAMAERFHSARSFGSSDLDPVAFSRSLTFNHDTRKDSQQLSRATQSPLRLVPPRDSKQQTDSQSQMPESPLLPNRRGLSAVGQSEVENASNAYSISSVPITENRRRLLLGSSRLGEQKENMDPDNESSGGYSGTGVFVPVKRRGRFLGCFTGY